MPPASLRPRGFLYIAAACALAACARPTTSGARGPTPTDLAALEAQRAQHPEDAALQLRLAKAYYAANRFSDARAALAVVFQARPSDEARAYLGLTYEGLNQFDSARTVYTELLAAKRGGSVTRLLSGRLVLLTRHELQYQARQAIAREATLAATPPDPNTVAVMPFRYTGSDTTLRPLERGLAAIVVTDLSRVRRLRLVERERLQVLLDELQLAASGRVDPASGARSGRLIGAGQVIQGQFAEVPNANFRIDAAVVRATDAQVAATGSGADQLRALFDIEKQVVLQLLDRMGITLTPAEQAAISERPTRDIQAFLLYSRGLEAQDRGDFRGASQSFQAAAQRDPSFSAAQQQASVSQSAEVATAAPPSEVAIAVAPPETPPGGGAPPSGTLANALEGTNPTGGGLASSLPGAGPSTDALPPPAPGLICESVSCDGPARAALIGILLIIITRP